MNHKLLSLSLLMIALQQIPTFGAKAIDLSQQNLRFLRQSTLAAGKKPEGVKELSSVVDFNQVKHIRIQQTYAGFPVWGADGVIHIPARLSQASLSKTLISAPSDASTMNGIFYQGITQDLGNEKYDLSKENQALALERYINRFYEKFGKAISIDEPSAETVIYIDDAGKAHWAYYLQWTSKASGQRTIMARLLVDAKTHELYRSWNDFKTLSSIESVSGGGFGGNVKIGKLIYDGSQGNLPALNMERDSKNKICYLNNKEVAVSDDRKMGLANFRCERKDETHNQVYWDGDFDAINGGYSPNNDALYAGMMLIKLYKDWYQVPVLGHKNKPVQLKMVTHSTQLFPKDNAAWDGHRMLFGDGESVFYPLTSLGVAAHEVSHGFTQYHSNLIYKEQSGGMNEAFSDMATQAIEYLVSDGKENSWQVGREVFKKADAALRYLDNPSKDCGPFDEKGLDCSLSTMQEYDAYVDLHKNDKPSPWEDTRFPGVHFSSGIFNRAFYLLATSPNWNTHKAFDVMVKANQNYWRAASTFKEGACGVIKATQDYKYDSETVIRAFGQVGIDTKDC